MRGQADDLGGGVFKKRLNDNRHRSIVRAKLARAYARITPGELEQALEEGDLLELSDDH